MMARARQALQARLPLFDTLLSIVASKPKTRSAKDATRCGARERAVGASADVDDRLATCRKGTGIAFALSPCAAPRASKPGYSSDAVVLLQRSATPVVEPRDRDGTGINAARYAHSRRGNPTPILFVCEDNKRRHLGRDTPRRWITDAFYGARRATCATSSARRRRLPSRSGTRSRLARSTTCRAGLARAGLPAPELTVRLWGHAGQRRRDDATVRCAEIEDPSRRKDPLLARTRDCSSRHGAADAPTTLLRALVADTRDRVRAASRRGLPTSEAGNLRADQGRWSRSRPGTTTGRAAAAPPLERKPTARHAPAHLRATRSPRRRPARRKRTIGALHQRER